MRRSPDLPTPHFFLPPSLPPSLPAGPKSGAECATPLALPQGHGRVARIAGGGGLGRAVGESPPPDEVRGGKGRREGRREGGRKGRREGRRNDMHFTIASM